MTVIRIATFNIRYGTAPDGPNGWDSRRAAVVDAITRQATGPPVLFGLQEVLPFQYDYLLAALGKDWCGTFVGRDDGRLAGEGTVLLWKSRQFYMLEPPTMFWYSDTPDVPGSRWTRYGAKYPRFCLQGLFVALGTDGVSIPGTEFRAWVTHFDHGPPKVREMSARLLIDRLPSESESDSKPLFFLGDLNSPPTEAAVDVLRHHLRDCLFSFGRQTDMLGTFHEFSGGDYGTVAHIDYIFLRSNSSKILAGKIDHDGYLDGKGKTRWPSDHFLVACDVQL